MARKRFSSPHGPVIMFRGKHKRKSTSKKVEAHQKNNENIYFFKFLIVFILMYSFHLIINGVRKIITSRKYPNIKVTNIL